LKLGAYLYPRSPSFRWVVWRIIPIMSAKLLGESEYGELIKELGKWVIGLWLIPSRHLGQ
jgi:hypothetical protein